MGLLILAAFGGAIALITIIVLAVVGWFFSLLRQDQNSKLDAYDLEDGDF